MKRVHISTIKFGDIVLHNGTLRTVGNKDIKSGFMGLTVFGDSYRLGTKLVALVDPQEVHQIEEKRMAIAEGI